MENRQSRSAVTRTALMRAAEKLIAERGIENVSIRDIVTAAGQKNESALQYHFGSRQGLIEALHSARQAEIQVKREALLHNFSAAGAAPSLREICTLMVGPVFELARTRADFRRYVKAFGQTLTLADESAVLANQRGGSSARQTGLLLQANLDHLQPATFRRRVDAALRFIAASMVHHARQKSAFRGAHAEVFFHSLIDALVGMLSAPESAETQAALRAAGERSALDDGPGFSVVARRAARGA